MIELADVPELRDPIMIAAFEGWNDAGEAATAAVEHLCDVWKAEPVAAIDGSAAWSMVPIAPSATRTRSARVARKRSERLLKVVPSSLWLDRPEVYRRSGGPPNRHSVVWSSRRNVSEELWSPQNNCHRSAIP